MAIAILGEKHLENLDHVQRLMQDRPPFYSNALGPLHSVQKNAEAVPIIPPGLSGPPWMLRPTDESLRVWHQGKNATSSIADAGYIVH